MKQIAQLLTLVLFITTGVTSFAQIDSSKYGENEEQQLKCMEALSVYKSFKKQKNYADAYPAWQTTCEVCPNDVSRNLYSHGALFIKSEMKSTKDKERLKVLVDSLMVNYDTWMEVFPETEKKPLNGCEVLSRKATDMYKIYKKRHTEANAMYKEVLDCMKDQTPANAIDGYYRSLFEVYKAAPDEEKDGHLSALLTDYLMLQDYCDASIKRETNEKIVEQYTKVRGNLDEVFVLIAQCDQMTPVLQAKVEANPEDMELKKKVLRLMNKKDCTEGDFFLQVAQEVYKEKPEATSAFSIGMALAKKSEYSESLQYLEEAAEMCTDCPDRETYLLKAGQVASVLKRASTARKYANKVIEMNPSSGEAYILHGDAIAGMTKACDDGALGARSVYWLATDYYNRAKSKDSSVADRVNKKISQMRQQYPTKEDIFGFSLKEGASFTVPCIGESTTIRVR